MSPPRQALLSHMGEFQLIRSIARGFAACGSRPLVGIGDDAAILSHPSATHLVISTDLLVEDIHFSRSTASYYDIGYKAAVANLSDIAAMGATPMYILVAVALPAHLTYHDWKEIYRGISAPCKIHRVGLVGGDTSASLSSLFLAITILGEVEPDRGLTRDGAKEGDIIYLSGSLGNSAAGLECLTRRPSPELQPTLQQHMKFLMRRHLRPTPRIGLGRLLSSQGLASAALDVSDGLSGDLGHLCRQSQVGALIHEVNLPLSPHLISYASQTRLNPLLWALHGGEEYELLFTVPSTHQRHLERATKKLRIPVTAIGKIAPRRSGVRIVYRDGTIKKLLPQSYVHFS